MYAFIGTLVADHITAAAAAGAIAILPASAYAHFSAGLGYAFFIGITNLARAANACAFSAAAVICAAAKTLAIWNATAIDAVSAGIIAGFGKIGLDKAIAAIAAAIFCRNIFLRFQLTIFCAYSLYGLVPVMTA